MAERSLTTLRPDDQKAIPRRVAHEVWEDNVPLAAAATAFYATLGIFPAFVLVLSVLAFVTDPNQVEARVNNLSRMLPDQAGSFLQSSLHGLASAGTGRLTAGFAFGLVGALFSASTAVSSLLNAVNIAYDIEETRSWWKRRVVATGLALGAMAAFAVMVAILIMLPALLSSLDMQGVLPFLLRWGRWPVVVLFALVSLNILYRYAPAEKPHWRFVSWGAGIGTVLWIVGSIGFSIYASSTGRYREMYGSFAGPIVLMLWLLVSSWAVLLGAEIDSEMLKEAGERDSEPVPPAASRGS